jgi:hypothetical protein
MKMELKSLMKDKNVLRVMVFLAATNVLGYLLIRDFDAIALLTSMRPPAMLHVSVRA